MALNRSPLVSRDTHRFVSIRFDGVLGRDDKNFQVPGFFER
jgi:hypothetical protein